MLFYVSAATTRASPQHPTETLLSP